MGVELVRFFMANLISPVVAGAGLSFGLLFLMAVANGITGLVFNKSITQTVNGKIGTGGSE